MVPATLLDCTWWSQLFYTLHLVVPVIVHKALGGPTCGIDNVSRNMINRISNCQVNIFIWVSSEEGVLLPYGLVCSAKSGASNHWQASLAPPFHSWGNGFPTTVHVRLKTEFQPWDYKVHSNCMGSPSANGAWDNRLMGPLALINGGTIVAGTTNNQKAKNSMLFGR